MPSYQRQNSTGHEHIEIDLYRDFQFMPHFHRDLELFLVLEGELQVIVHGRMERAGAGCAGLVLPNQVHAYRTEEHSLTLVCPFSASYVGEFMRAMEGKSGRSTVFTASPPLMEYLKECLMGGMPDRLRAKAAFYAACAAYLEKVELARTAEAPDDPIHSLLTYVEEHYREDITLKSAARAIGYHENYLSHYFHQVVGVNFRRFLNQYRVDYACRRMAGSVRLSELALECGFQNIRCFNRAFLEITGMTPSEYRRGMPDV